MLAFYKSLMRAAVPVLKVYLKRRIRSGKEDAARLPERWGVTNIARPDGKILWCHAASVGESLALIPLIKKLKADNPAVVILLTTGTVTSAKLIEKRIGALIIHQYIPLDVPQWIDRFLKHWQPAMALFVESELWPNMLQALKMRHCPAVLINARLSQKSFRKWQKRPKAIKKILACFDLIIAQSRADEEAYLNLGAQRVIAAGNLKFAAEPLPVDYNLIGDLKNQIGKRPSWMMASSHDGEDQIALMAHNIIRQKEPGLLTLLAPRHNERADKIANIAKNMGYNVSQRSKLESIAGKTDIYIVDTMGELGSFFAITPIVCVGGSLVPKGGHNLIEPGQFGCALLHGPYMTSSPLIRDVFHEHNATMIVNDANTTARAVKELLSEPILLQQKKDASIAVINSEKSVMNDVFDQLTPLFLRVALIQDHA